MKYLLICFILICSMLGAWADPRPTLVPMRAQWKWDAIGRVNVGGFNTKSTCTGTLVAPDLVITASHCVAKFRNTEAKLADLHFVAGWNRGEYAAHRTAKAVLFHPKAPKGRIAGATIPFDIALIALESAIPETTVAPLPVLGLFPQPETVDLIGYRNDRIHAPSLSKNCSATWYGPLLNVGCPVVPGNSGGPVLDLTTGSPRVIAVISARSNGHALTAPIDDWVLDQIHQYQPAITSQN